VPLEQQVIILWAAINGFLDELPIEKIKEFEATFIQEVKIKEKQLLKKVICVHPATWLIDNKGAKLLYKSFREAFEKHISNLEVFNGNLVFDIKLFVPCVITVIDISLIFKTVKVNWFAKPIWEISSLDMVTMHGPDWDPTVKNFQDKVLNYCLTNGCILNHLIHWSTANNEKYQIQLPKIRGHVAYDVEDKTFQDDFYTFIQENPENNKGIRKEQGKIENAEMQASKTILQIDTRQEQDNLLKYLQSDFARLCLSLFKTNQHLNTGETKIVPWMDFTRLWTDDELFSELGYYKGHAIREYAKDFLPDYHNLYPHGKTY